MQNAQPLLANDLLRRLPEVLGGEIADVIERAVRRRGPYLNGNRVGEKAVSRFALLYVRARVLTLRPKAFDFIPRPHGVGDIGAMGDNAHSLAVLVGERLVNEIEIDECRTGSDRGPA